MTRPYHLQIVKKRSTKTDAELAELKAKYADGVPSEIIDHLSEKMADEVLGVDDVVAELPKGSRRRGAE